MPSSTPSKDVSRKLKTQLKKAFIKPMAFFYCAGGSEGEPILIVDRQVKSAASKTRKEASIKQFAEGSVCSMNGRDAIFILDTSEPPKFQRHMKMWFGKAIPALKKSEFYSRKDWMQQMSPESVSPEEESPLVDSNLPDFDDESEAKSQLSPDAEHLHWRAIQTLKYSERYVKAARKWQRAYHRGQNKSKAVDRMSTQLERLNKWTERVLTGAEAYAKAIEEGLVTKKSAEKPFKELKQSRSMLWKIHKHMSEGHHAEGYPSTKLKRAASRSRGQIKKAYNVLKQAK